MTKDSKRKKHGVEAVKITSDNKGSVVYYWLRRCPRDHSQYENNNIYNKCCKIQDVPLIAGKSRKGVSDPKKSWIVSVNRVNANANANRLILKRQ